MLRLVFLLHKIKKYIHIHIQLDHYSVFLEAAVTPRVAARVLAPQGKEDKERRQSKTKTVSTPVPDRHYVRYIRFIHTLHPLHT